MASIRQPLYRRIRYILYLLTLCRTFQNSYSCSTLGYTPVLQWLFCAPCFFLSVHLLQPLYIFLCSKPHFHLSGLSHQLQGCQPTQDRRAGGFDNYIYFSISSSSSVFVFKSLVFTSNFFICSGRLNIFSYPILIIAA